MSQVKKLQTGGNTPKQYGHLIVDGIDYGNSEELYNAFARHAKAQHINQGEFYDQWLTALRNGQDVTFGNGNTVNLKPDAMTDKRAGKRSNWTKFWDDTFDTRRNHFSDAIATARGFTFTATPETPKQKSPFDTSEIILNYNDDPKKKGHRIWSVGHADNQRAIQRVSDAIAGLKDQDNSDYTFNDSLKAAYQIAVNSGMTPEEYAQAVWGRLQDNAWTGYKSPENDNDLDWLRAFGIGVGPYTAPEQPTAPATATAAPAQTPTNDDKDKQIAELKAQLAALQGGQGSGDTQTQQTEKPQVVIYRSIPGTKVTATDPDADGWRTYNFTVTPGHYQYNTNVNVSTARPTEQPRTERTDDDRLSMIAKMIGENPLVYNNVTYPIVQEKDTDRYFALTNNGRLQLDQDFVTRWLENKLTEDDNKKMSLWAGQKAKTTNDKGEELNWLGKIWARLNGPDAYVDTSKQARQDRINAYKANQKTGSESQLARAKANYERSLAAGGSKDPAKNRYAKAYFDLQKQMQKKALGGIIKFEWGGTNWDSTPAWQSAIKTGLAALDYGSMAWGRQKVHDQIERGLKESLYKKTTPRLQGITTATPIEDAAVDRYDQYVQRGLTTPLTSDNVTNTQNVLTLQANALQGRDQAVRQQSAAALQRQMQNQQIANQQAQIDAEAENDFRARLSGLRMNLAQNDASLTAQTAQSIQNLAREWRTRYEQQLGKYNQLQYNSEVTGATEAAENNWKGILQRDYSDAWNEWTGFDNNTKAKYGNSITEWLQQSPYWNDAMETAYAQNQKSLNDKILSSYRRYNLAPELQWMYRRKYAVTNRKSGGTLTIKPRNRYKNEPSEDIWINQNKATHKLVAKLNDNVIKTFLKTLK